MQHGRRQPSRAWRDVRRGCGVIAAVLAFGLLISCASGCYREHRHEYGSGSRQVGAHRFSFGLHGSWRREAPSTRLGAPFTLFFRVDNAARRPKRIALESVSLRTARGSREVGVPGVGALPLTEPFHLRGERESWVSFTFGGIEPPEEDLVLTLRCRIDDEPPLTFEVELPVTLRDSWGHPFLDALMSV